MNIANSTPKSKTIDLHHFYTKIDTALNIIYSQESFLISDIKELLQIKSGLTLLSSLFRTEIDNRKAMVNQIDAILNLIRTEKIQNEIDIIQGFLKHNRELDEEIDELIDNILFLLPPITFVLQ